MAIPLYRMKESLEQAWSRRRHLFYVSPAWRGSSPAASRCSGAPSLYPSMPSTASSIPTERYVLSTLTICDVQESYPFAGHTLRLRRDSSARQNTLGTHRQRCRTRATRRSVKSLRVPILLPWCISVVGPAAFQSLSNTATRLYTS